MDTYNACNINAEFCIMNIEQRINMTMHVPLIMCSIFRIRATTNHRGSAIKPLHQEELQRTSTVPPEGLSEENLQSVRSQKNLQSVSSEENLQSVRRTSSL